MAQKFQSAQDEMPADYYNAVFRNARNQVVARTFLTDPRNLPWSWKVKYGDKEIMDAKELEGVLCGPCQPLNISRRDLFSKRKGKRARKEPGIEVKVVWNNNEASLKVQESHSLEDVGFMVARKLGGWIPGFSLNGKLLSDGRLTMKDLGVSANNNVFKQLSKEKIFEAISTGSTNCVNAMSLKGPTSGSKTFWIPVKTLTGKTINLQVAPASSVLEVPNMEGIREDQQRLIYAVPELTPWYMPRDYMQAPTLHLVYRLRGGGSALNFSDVEGKCVTGRGKPVRPEDRWKAYRSGLNLKGNCANPECKSQEYPAKDLVVYQFGFGPLMLTTSSTFECPACRHDTFKPADFLISGANCEFRFRKSEEKIVKSRNLVSGPYPEYLKLEDGEGKVEYEFIEILSVPLEESPHYCCICGERIGKLVNEVKLPDCRHYRHTECSKRKPGCPVCHTLMVVENEFRKLAIMAENLDDFI